MKDFSVLFPLFFGASEAFVLALLSLADHPMFIIIGFLAASTEYSAGSNDHFVVGGGVVPSLVQFDGWPLVGANFQHSAITQPCNATNHATFNARNNHATEQLRNLATQQSRNL
jgi:hypothetical protein